MGIKKKYILPIKWKLQKWRAGSEWQRPDGEDMQRLIEKEKQAYHKAKRANSIKEENYHLGRYEALKELWELPSE